MHKRRIWRLTVDTSPLLKSLGAGSEHQSVKQRLGREESLVLEHGNPESDILSTVSLFGSFSLDKSLGLEGSEFELDVGGLGSSVSELGQVQKTFLFST
jgi:hypothetical protein